MRSENEVPTRAKPQQTTTLLLLPAIRYAMESFFFHWIFKTHDQSWMHEVSRKLSRRTDEWKGNFMMILWARKLVWDLMLAACARDVSEMCDDFPPGCHKHLSLRFFMASYRTLLVVCTTLHVSISSTHFSPSVHFFCVVIFSNVSQRWKKSRLVSSHFHVKFSRLSHHMFWRIVCDQFSNVADVERASFLII